MQNKFTISFNIGYKSELFASGILTSFPVVFNDCTIKEFSKIVRRDVDSLYDWAEKNVIPLGSLYLLVVISNKFRYADEKNKHFAIKMYNVREYKKFVEDKIEEKRKQEGSE